MRIMAITKPGELAPGVCLLSRGAIPWGLGEAFGVTQKQNGKNWVRQAA
jgi:hypothetical protein